MYLTNEKTKHSSWVGSYKTRKWNDVTSIIYFEKVYGGKSLLKKIKLETGVNNILNEYYFTRRATGYPGPGIIPSEPRSYYLTIQVKLQK